MKKLSLLLCLLISFNVLASPLSKIEQSLDEYHYAMTVEWDQKDQKFSDEKTQVFIVAIQTAIAEGASKEDIYKLAESKMKSSQSLEALKLKMNLLTSQAANSAELAEILKLNSADFYTQGTSWNGDASNVIMWGALALAVGFIVWFSIKYKCVEEERYRDCDWETDSDGDRDYVCRNKTRCLEYVER
jgi:hypothetical protein